MESVDTGTLFSGGAERIFAALRHYYDARIGTTVDCWRATRTPGKDKSTITFRAKERRTLALFQSNRLNVKAYFRGIKRLSKKYPNSPFLLVRLAAAHVLLEDVPGSLQIFERAHVLLHDQDVTFEKYLKVLHAFVQKQEEEEEQEWSQPEGSFIVSPHLPPEPISAYFYGAVYDENVKAACNALLSQDVKDFTVDRYSRLLAVESNEIEGVFHLGGHSLVRLVRAGFYIGAIDVVLDSPSGRPDPSKVVTILKLFGKALEIFTRKLRTYSDITLKDICRLHHLLMFSSQISSVKVDDEMIDYLVPLGVYRRRLVTTMIDGMDGVVQFTKWKDIPAEMVLFMGQLKHCLSSTASPFVKAAWIHSTFARIHPFTDGNGRIARILASIPLIKAELPFINVRPAFREEYMQAVFTAQTEYNLQPLTDLLVKSMEDSMQFIANLPPPSPEDQRWTHHSNSHGGPRMIDTAFTDDDEE